MRKISIVITNNKKKEIEKELLSSGFDLSKLEVLEQKRKHFIEAKIGFFWFNIKSFFSFFYQRIKELVKHRRLEPMFGGGDLDFESFYGPVFYLATAVIIPGLAFDTIKIVIKKSYKFFKSKKLGYIALVSETRQPFDCKVKVLIPSYLKNNFLVK